MCMNSNNRDCNQNPNAQRGIIEVVISGAGPAGLLAAIHLLRRNEKQCACDEDSSQQKPKYRVTLIDVNVDYGSLSPAELKSTHRSWMIGLSTHGLTAIKEIPDLYENYVSTCGVGLKSNAIYLGKGRTKFQISAEENEENYVVDRNFVVAALARYLHERYGKSEYFQPIYETKSLYVDAEHRRIMIRSKHDKRAGTETYVGYDILLGCDGVRSVVRDVLAKHHRDFEHSASDTFTKMKAVHVDRPEDVDDECIVFLTNPLPNMVGIGLPETENKLNIAMAYYKNNPCHEEMMSSDPEIIVEYMKKHFKAFELRDYNDFAQQWIDQEWSTTGQVHCNFYHSNRYNVLLLGDAAHATSPAIGQGMNTALADASVLNRLLDEYNDDWSLVLPVFSEERVKEGNALTNLSFYGNSMSIAQAIRIQMEQIVRIQLSKWLPSGWVTPEPMYMIGKGEKLSVAYNTLVKLGRIQAVRGYNDRVRQEYFERSIGMVVEEERGGGMTWRKVVGCTVVVGVIGVTVMVISGKRIT